MNNDKTLGSYDAWPSSDAPRAQSNESEHIPVCCEPVPTMGQSLCTLPYRHEGEHRCSAADVDARKHAPSVADYSDASLVERAVRNCHRLHRRKQPYWASVADAFGLGSTYAAQLCGRFGINPDSGRGETP